VKRKIMSEGIKVIDEGLIQQQLRAGQGRSKEEILAIVAKAREAKGIEPQETASLLQVEDPELIEEFFQAAREIKLKIYGKRLVLFAPL
jgi:2-iminoacetate synthase